MSQYYEDFNFKNTSNGIRKVNIRVVATFVVLILRQKTTKSLAVFPSDGLPSHSDDESLAALWTLLVAQRYISHAAQTLRAADLQLAL